jgi:outer membrane protein OmpA-like peptidoglycan-associated protein
MKLERGLFTPKRKNFLRIAAATLPCTIAQAQSSPMPGTSLSLLLGLGGGGLASISQRDIESDKYGFETHGRAMASLAVSQIVLDFGAGWYLSNVYGSTDEKSRRNGDKDEIKTRAGFGEFTASYRFSEDWILGPSARFTYGTETSFSPTDFSTKTPRVHLGGRIGHQPLSKTGTVRVGLFAYTDLNIDHRQITYGGLSFDFVLPLIKGDIVTQEKIVEKEKTVEVEKIVEKEVVIEKVIPQDNFIHTLDGSMVNFETDKDLLLPHSREFILKLGRALVENSDAWTQLEIQGHTDNRGEDEYNRNLSERRAFAVRTALIESGVNSEKLSSKGYGESQPLDPDNSELAWARNRRVELVFGGVTDGPRLAGIIEKVRRQSYMPQNCGPAGCK